MHQSFAAAVQHSVFGTMIAFSSFDVTDEVLLEHPVASQAELQAAAESVIAQYNDEHPQGADIVLMGPASRPYECRQAADEEGCVPFTVAQLRPMLLGAFARLHMSDFSPSGKAKALDGVDVATQTQQEEVGGVRLMRIGSAQNVAGAQRPASAGPRPTRDDGSLDAATEQHISKAAYPMFVLPGSVLRSLTRLPAHEEALAKGLVRKVIRVELEGRKSNKLLVIEADTRAKPPQHVLGSEVHLCAAAT